MITSRRLGLLGLGLRAGQVVVGTSAVRDALRRDELSLVIIAQDRSERTDEKVTRLARSRGIEVLEGPRADELGRRLGRESVQTAGVKDPHLAAGLRGQTAAQDI